MKGGVNNSNHVCDPLVRKHILKRGPCNGDSRGTDSPTCETSMRAGPSLGVVEC